MALREGAYVELAGGWIGVAPARSQAGPLTLLVEALPPRPFAAGAPAAVARDTLVVDGIAIDVSGVQPFTRPGRPPRAADVEPAVVAALDACPAPLPDLREGLDALTAGDLDAAVRLLAGRGPGLTPAGDDVLAGYAAWWHAEGAAPRVSDAAAGRSAPLGLAYLRCAERGELPAAAERALDAVRAADAVLAARHARALRSWGASSGAALLWGIAAGARAHDAAGARADDAGRARTNGSAEAGGGGATGARPGGSLPVVDRGNRRPTMDGR